MVEILKNFPLFQGIAMHDLRKLLRCLSAQEKSFEKGQWIINGEEPNQWVGIVLTGHVQLIHHDYYGNRTIFSGGVKGSSVHGQGCSANTPTGI